MHSELLRRAGAFGFSFLVLAGVARAEGASTEDTAKFLAGLPVASDSPLAPLEETPAWHQHEAFFNTTFARVDKTQIDKVKDWAAEHVNVRRSTLFYFFSGPDFLYANAFFPKAETYVLAGLEPSGPIPDLAKVPKAVMPKALRGLEVSLRSILGLSFFQTKYMSGEFHFNPVSGTIPVLYIFMARSGKEVHSATLIQLDENGEVSTDLSGPRKGARGVKIGFSSPGGPEQTLYYFSGNVAGTGFKASGLEAFCDKLGRGDSFVKSASYLLHGRDFAGIRNFILKHSDAILQDDTGIPIYLYDKTWELTPYGRYVGPIPLFRRAFQKELAALHRKNKSQLIDFSIGYRYRPNEASLVWAVKQGATEEAKPEPKAETKPTEKTDSKPAAQPEAKPVEKTDPKPAVQPEAKPAEKTDAKPQTTEVPKAAEPKTEAPKAEAPKAEAPKSEAPKTEAPKTDADKPVSSPQP